MRRVPSGARTIGARVPSRPRPAFARLAHTFGHEHVVVEGELRRQARRRVVPVVPLEEAAVPETVRASAARAGHGLEADERVLDRPEMARAVESAVDDRLRRTRAEG